RIEPVVDSATPEQNEVVVTDARHDSPHGWAASSGWRRVWQAKRHDIDQPAQTWVLLVCGWIYTVRDAHRPDPEISLTLAGTQEEVTDPDLLDQHPQYEFPIRKLPWRLVKRHGRKVLQVERIVEIGNQAGTRLPEHGAPGKHPSHADDHVLPEGDMPECVGLNIIVGHDGEGLTPDVCADGCSQRHLVAAEMKLVRQFEAPDGRPRHCASDVVLRDDEDPGHPTTEYATTPRNTS